ncbi:MAG: protein kinase [Peptococcaceae bacterium]|nr:protein kinase [Peptococcaceae bacterium]
MADIKTYEPLWGAWHVESLLGEGGFGKVYKVRREEFGKTYYSAVKIVSIPHDESEIRQMKSEGLDEASMHSFLYTFVTDIISEIHLMRQFRGNSNVVSLEDHQIIEKTDSLGWDILIRMELLTSLSDHAMQTPLTKADIVKVGIDICRALELCAKRNTLHRDIKPDNIFISPYGEYKLGDFGIARQLERASSALSKKGTYTYMAPEIFRGEQYGPNVDTYSLGIVLYRFLNQNRTPFLPDFPQAIKPSDRDMALKKRMNGVPMPLLKGVSHELNNVVLKACAHNRQGRFTSPTEMREALENIAETQNYESAATGIPGQPSPPILNQTYAIPGQNPSFPTPGRQYAPSRPEQSCSPSEHHYVPPPAPGTIPQSPAPDLYANPAVQADKPPPMSPRKKSNLPLIIALGTTAAVIAVVSILLLYSQGSPGSPGSSSSSDGIYSSQNMTNDQLASLVRDGTIPATLHTLDLSNNQISDITPLKSLTHLTTLNLNNNQISDLTSLAGLLQLTELRLGGNSLSSSALTSLEPLKELTKLSINDNNVNDLKNLEKLTALEELDINKLTLTTITPLKSLKKLKMLHASELTADEVSELKDALPQCTITNFNFTNDPKATLKTDS